MKNTKKTNSC